MIGGWGGKYVILGPKTLRLNNWYVTSPDFTQWIDYFKELDSIFTLDVDHGIGFLTYWICQLKLDFWRKELSKNDLSNPGRLFLLQPAMDIRCLKNWILQPKFEDELLFPWGQLAKCTSPHILFFSILSVLARCYLIWNHLFYLTDFMEIRCNKASTVKTLLQTVP